MFYAILIPTAILFAIIEFIMQRKEIKMYKEVIEEVSKIGK